MPTRRGGRGECRAAYAVIIVLSVGLRRGRAVALADIDRIAPRCLLYGVMHARSRVHQKPRIQATYDERDESGQHQGEFHRCSPIVANRNTWYSRDGHC